jgi:hypothetical protein
MKKAEFKAVMLPIETINELDLIKKELTLERILTGEDYKISYNDTIKHLIKNIQQLGL